MATDALEDDDGPGGHPPPPPPTCSMCLNPITHCTCPNGPTIE